MTLRKHKRAFLFFLTVLRFGKSLDLLQGALRAIELDSVILKLTLTLSKINQAAYLAVDHLIWAGKIGLAETDTKKWAKVSARFWLVTLFFNLVRNAYDIYLIILKYMALQRRRAKQIMNGQTNYGPKEKEGDSTLKRTLVENKPVVIDVVKNLADVTLPLSSLGYLNTTVGFQGAMGIISSIMGILVVWDPLLKLNPS